MSKWKLKIEAPFQGIAPKSYRAVNDYFYNYGNSNQSIDIADNYDLSIPGYLGQPPLLQNVTNYNGTDYIKYITDYTVPYQSIPDAAYAIGMTGLYEISVNTITSLRTVTNMTEGESLVQFGGNLFYFYNRSSDGNIGKFDLNYTYDDTWGSTVSGGTVSILEKKPHPVTKTLTNVFFGNGQYLGRITSGLTLAYQHINYGVGSEVSDLGVTNNYLYVAVNYYTGGSKKRGTIYVYDSELSSTDPVNTINVKYEITGLHIMNGVVYIFYDDTGYGKLGYISGSQVVELTEFYGKPPRFNHITEKDDNLVFAVPNADRPGIYFYKGGMLYKKYYVTGNSTNSNNIIVGALASPFKDIYISSKTAIPSTAYYLKREPVNSDTNIYNIYGDWTSVAQIVGDSDNDSIIDNIVVYTNYLGPGAGATLTLRTNNAVSTFTITGACKIKHVLRNIDKPADIFNINISWDNGSATTPCMIKKIIVNGHTREK